MEENTPFSIKYWAEDDKPREKLMLKGKAALSDAELIAILIGSGNRDESAVDLSKRILASVENLNALGKLSLQQLTNFKGIGEAKAISIIAAMELGRRRRAEETVELTKITSSRIAYEIMQPIIGELPHEEFWILVLNRANFVTSKHLVSRGGQSGTIADPKIIFKIAIENNAANIVLAHNHPSGNLKASAADINLTKKMVQAGLLLEIPIYDHLIITDNSYLSLADESLM